MPLYDFRCADCTAEREVLASMDESGSLELVCVDCGGPMTRTVNRTFTFVSGSAGSAPPSPPPARPQHQCTDGAVKLSRPNPFKQSLPAKPGEHSRG